SSISGSASPSIDTAPPPPGFGRIHHLVPPKEDSATVLPACPQPARNSPCPGSHFEGGLDAYRSVHFRGSGLAQRRGARGPGAAACSSPAAWGSPTTGSTPVLQLKGRAGGSRRASGTISGSAATSLLRPWPTSYTAGSGT